MATIGEILTWPSGAPVPELICTISRANEVREGVGQYGPWRCIDVELKDAGGTMWGQVWNPEMTPQALQNRRVRIAAAADGKGVPRGAVLLRDTYQGAERCRLKVQGDHIVLYEPVQSSQPAPASAPRPVPGQLPLPAASGGPVTLSRVIALIDHLTATLLALGYEYGVLAAIVNTVLIAVTQGRVSIDIPLRVLPPAAPTEPPEDDFAPWPENENP